MKSQTKYLFRTLFAALWAVVALLAIEVALRVWNAYEVASNPILRRESLWLPSEDFVDPALKQQNLEAVLAKNSLPEQSSLDSLFQPSHGDLLPWKQDHWQHTFMNSDQHSKMALCAYAGVTAIEYNPDRKVVNAWGKWPLNWLPYYMSSEFPDTEEARSLGRVAGASPTSSIQETTINNINNSIIFIPPPPQFNAP